MGKYIVKRILIAIPVLIGITIIDCSDSLSILSDYKRRKILIDCSGFLSKCLDCIMSGIKHPALSEDMCLPAFSDHIPVSIIAVHCYDHSSTA